MKIVSLGTNCEVSFFIEQFCSKPIDSYISSWARMNFDAIKCLDMFENLDKIVDSDWTILPWGMFKNERFNVGFHPKMSKEELFEDNGSLNVTAYDNALSELKSRLAHLAEKTEKLFSSTDSESILFVCKIDDNYENTMLYLARLSQILREKVKRDNYLLLALSPLQEVDKLNYASISKNLIVCHVDYLQSPPIKRRGGFDLDNWEHAFRLAIDKLKNQMVEKYNANLIKNAKTSVVKSGDAQGNYDDISKELVCSSSDNSYFGIAFELENLEELKGKKIMVHLQISDVQSKRKDIGYLQIWNNSLEQPQTYSDYLENITYDKRDYWVQYTIPININRFRLVVQAKNGSFCIENISLQRSYL